MLDILKNMAIKTLSEKMGANALNDQATGEAASEGANALLDNIKSAISGGNLDQVKDLFSSGGAATQDNALFQNLQGKMTEILQSKGMSAEDAAAEAQNTAPNLVESLKSKFESSDASDSAFDIGSLTSLIGGDAGDILGKVKNLF